NDGNPCTVDRCLGGTCEHGCICVEPGSALGCCGPGPLCVTTTTTPGSATTSTVHATTTTTTPGSTTTTTVHATTTTTTPGSTTTTTVHATTTTTQPAQTGDWRGVYGAWGIFAGRLASEMATLRSLGINTVIQNIGLNESNLDPHFPGWTQFY